MGYFKLMENLPGSKNKYSISCSTKKCTYEFERNDLWFCYFTCGVCKKKSTNPNHIGYHIERKRCLYEIYLNM